MEKVRVWNKQKFDVGVKTFGHPLGVNIPSKSFIPMDKDEVAQLISTCSLFQRGILTVEEANKNLMEEGGVFVEDLPNCVTDEEIQKFLSGSAKKLEEWLKTITEGYVLERIYDKAMTMNLQAGKLRILQEKMPTRDFLAARHD